jgi:methylated-DNA-[protein]-cysteine S-methyltransferase
MTTYAHRFRSPLGELFIAVNDEGALLRLLFAGNRDRDALTAGLVPPIERSAARCAHVVRQMDEYFHSERRDFDLKIELQGTEFQKRVWKELQRIPYGETISYRQLAARLGRPTATRAVGRANATNPISVVVPCHRVIGADGSLTGFGGGIDVKRSLLQHEGALRELF